MKNVDSEIGGIVSELESVSAGIAAARADSMTYQRREKLIVSGFYGIPFEFVDVGFNDWMRIRSRYESDSGNTL